MKDRPAGITLIAILYFSIGIFSVLWGGLVLGLGGLSALFGSIFDAQRVADFGITSAWAGYFGLITAFFQIVVGFGLLGIKRWGWILALIGVVLTILEGVMGIVIGGQFGFICGSLGLIVPVILLIYLLKKETREVFD